VTLNRLRRSDASTAHRGQEANETLVARHSSRGAGHSSRGAGHLSRAFPMGWLWRTRWVAAAPSPSGGNPRRESGKCLHAAQRDAARAGICQHTRSALLAARAGTAMLRHCRRQPPLTTTDHRAPAAARGGAPHRDRSGSFGKSSSRAGDKDAAQGNTTATGRVRMFRDVPSPTSPK
jgi:hypothetical protein